MANPKLTLPAKAAAPKMIKCVVLKYVYNALGSRPLPIGSVQDFADDSSTEHLVKLGFLKRANAETAANAAAINAAIDLKPAQAMPASPAYSVFPFNPTSFPKA
jgi:hypothetical protein